MSITHIISLKNISRPDALEVIDLDIGVTIESINTKTKEVEYIIDWAEYFDGEHVDNCMVWKRASPNMCNSLYWVAGDKIREALLAIQEELEYNEAEDNGYPDW